MTKFDRHLRWIYFLCWGHRVRKNKRLYPLFKTTYHFCRNQPLPFAVRKTAIQPQFMAWYGILLFEVCHRQV